MLKKGFFLSFLIILGVFLLKIDTHQISSSFRDFSSTLPIYQMKQEQEKELAILEIPKLKIKEKIYPFESKLNQVDQHVTILEGSTLPNLPKSHIFLAAHSGRGRAAYFKELDQLSRNDSIFFLYQNTSYHYKVTYSYEIEKDGDIEGSYTNDHQLILTTCSPTHKSKQLIVEAILIPKKEN